MFLDDLNRNAQRLDPLETLSESIEENAEYIADLNTSQLSEGVNSLGQSLDPKYKMAEYAKMKKAMGAKPPFGTPDLKLTGAFYEGFRAEPLKADKGGIFITSDDSKASKLAGKYGANIFGLTDKSRADLKTVLLPTFLTKLRNELFRP